MSGRYEKTFGRLKGREGRPRGAFIPFVTLGDPNHEESGAILETLVEAGADALELGIPFSDPVADGPVIQTASNRALDAGATPASCMALVKRTRAAHPDIPIGLLVYANLVVSRGLDAFYGMAAEAGVDSVLVADVPVMSSRPFVDAALRAGVAPVFIVPPNADEQKLRQVAALSKGYTYYLGRNGVTGAEREMDEFGADAASRIALLKEAGSPPVVVGFGISKPEHVRAAIRAGADGAIAGSATVKIIAEHLGDPRSCREALRRFVTEMSKAS
ncbi:MAG: tryptophan synthase subunit alpha [Synergistaceae bacterium]|jgi:tryptophan synthase alpha chain|nr:tryptophan synthase subunit alpha [Synergistaceae bacterium]